MTKRVLAVALGFAFAAVLAPAPSEGATTTHAAIPPCDVAPWYVYAMPDGKTYAIVFASKTGKTRDVHLDLYSDRSEYAAAVPALDFDPVQLAAGVLPPPGPRAFKSPVVFVTLPQTDALLVASAQMGGSDPASTEPCRAEHAKTESYWRITESKPHVTDQGDVDRQKLLVEVFKQGVDAIPALMTIAQTSTAARACAVRYRDATATAPSAPDYPEMARQQGAQGVVLITVELNADGSVAEVTVYKSSGNSFLDGAALAAAQRSKYRAEIFRCERIPGTYIFHADFRAY